MAVDDVGISARLYVRVLPQSDGRLRIIELYLDAPDPESPITGDEVRQLPIGRIEAMVNAYAEEVVKQIDHPGPNLSTLATYYATGFMDYPREIAAGNWVATNFADVLTDEQLKEANLPPFRRMKPQPRKWRTDTAGFVLSSGPTNGLTDEFLRDVARAYAAAVARGERPNKAIADQTDTPLKTVQRWVYTARQRGIMPRGRKGVPG